MKLVSPEIAVCSSNVILHCDFMFGKQIWMRLPLPVPSPWVCCCILPVALLSIEVLDPFDETPVACLDVIDSYRGLTAVMLREECIGSCVETKPTTFTAVEAEASTRPSAAKVDVPARFF